MNLLKKQAIQTALEGKWEEAVKLNEEILLLDPEDIEALNRLGFAYTSIGDLKNAKNAYQKVLEIDRQNPIALKNLKRLSSSSSSNKNKSPNIMQIENIFIEEPGKTKVIDLINVAEQKIITSLRNGEKLNLGIKRMKIFLHDQEMQYVGMLPDDLGKRLIRFIDGGNIYEAYVKTTSSNKVTVFLKEEKRTSKFKNQPSFIQSDKSKLFFDAHQSKKQHKEHKNKKQQVDEEEQDNEDYSEESL